MSNSRNPSPARSLAASTPHRSKPRGTRSVGSPARSNVSTRLSAIVQKENMNSFAISPLGRRSVLNDDTDIELVPGRKSWWKRLDEKSRVMEVLQEENNQVVNFNNGVEDYMDVEILSQEKKNYTIDFPDSSDSESIASIVIPQRKLFTQKDVQMQNKFGQLIENRETLTKVNKTNVTEKSLKITKKNLFNQNRQRTRPAFPAELLQMSPNKTAANKTKEMPALEVKNQARYLFGNNAAKRKNMFADFIASESEDEIPEIQPKVFGFNKKPEPVRRGSSTSRGVRDSPTNMSLLPEMDDWKMLPSSTMVEHQLEEAIVTPVKRPTLSRPRQSDVPILEVPEPNEHNETPITTLVERSIAEKSILTRSGSKRKSLKAQSGDNNQKAIEKPFKTQQSIEENLDEPMQIEQDIKNLSRRSTRQNASQQLQISASKVTSHKVLDDLATEQILESSNEQRKKVILKADNENEQTTQKNAEINDQDEDDNFALEMEEDKEESDHEVQEKDNQEDTNASANENTDEIKVEQINKQSRAEQNEDCNNESVKENDEHVSENEEDQINESGVENHELISENEEENEVVDNESEEDNGKHVSENEEEHEVLNNEIEVENDEHVSENEKKHGEDEILNNESEVENNDHDSENDLEQVLSGENENKIEEHNNESEIETDEPVSENEEELANSDADNEGDNIYAEEQEIIADGQEEDEQVMESELEEQESDIEAEETENEQQNSEVQSDVEIDDQNADEAIQDDEEIEETNEQEDELVQNESDEEINQSFEDQQEISEELQESGKQNESLLHDNNYVEEDNLENSHQESDDEQNADEQDENEAPQDDNEEISASQEIDHAADIQESIDKTHDTTGRHRNKHDKISSPEAILHNATNEMESFSNRGRNTSIRKTKSMIVYTNQPSLAPHRDSTGFSDGTKNSSAEGSGWDSHRVTRKTMRQTFGKDFTPRKSLRALVMEKSAKRQTAISEMHTETIKHPQANSTEFPDDSGRVYEDAQESVHEVSLRTRQTTLEMYLQKVKKQNMENKMKIEEAVRNSIKARPNDHQFKVPSIPRRPNSKQNHNTKAKAVKPFLPVEELPTHIKEDLKYKPPKRFRPNNAGWITKRLYKFLETKLEPTYDYKARVRAEKLVVMIYEFTKQLRKNCMTKEAIQQLKHEMARLQIVRTHFEFYEFFNEFMPREVRVKVIPDIVNGIPVPRQDVFSDILR